MIFVIIQSMTEDVNDMLKAYSQETMFSFVPDEYTVQATQENGICGDSITVFLKINESWTIEQYSFSGFPQMFTKAAANLLGELIQGASTDDVLARDYQFMQNYGLDVSPRRKRSIVSALLAARNAIHQRKNDGIIDTYDTLLSL